jgi:cytoskeletal protein CcmA (bactofilin family)
MTMNKLPAVCVVFCAVLAMFSAATRAESEPDVIKKGAFEDDLFVNGDSLLVEADLAQDLIATGGKVVARSRIKGDVFSVGGKLELGDDIEGNVIATGGKITLNGRARDSATLFAGKIDMNAELDGDAFIAGGKVDIRGPVHGDLRGTAGRLTIHRSVDGNILLGAGEVELRDSADLKSKVTIGAGYLYAGGRIGQGLKAAGRKIIIAGVINGNVKLTAEEIRLLPTARINGNLTYRSPQAIKIHDDARIGGDVTFIQSEDMRRSMADLFALTGATHLSVILGLVLVAAAFVWAFPTLFQSMRKRILAHPYKVFGSGLAVLVGGPLLIMLLFVTAVGAPLAMILVDVYLLVVIVGFFSGAYGVGLKVFIVLNRDGESSAWRRLGVTSLGLVLLGLIALILILGAVVLIISISLGIGALAAELSLLRKLRQAA